ncbi:MAG: DUF1598 domain-containing protein [Phycisphaera sp.]|nr:DUF1598 domain-containing protein [Phycisphaera sp.]
MIRSQMTGLLVWVGMAAMLLGAVSTASAQLGRAGRGGAVAFDPQGVFIDAGGVLRVRTEGNGPLHKPVRATSAVKRDGELVYVSLPRVFAEARKAAEAGQPIPDELFYLGGMTKLRYVFVYPAADGKPGDVVIAGPGETFEPSESFRVTGKTTGRPVLQLDDLVTAMRTTGPGAKGGSGGAGQPFGCTIELTQEKMNAIVTELKRSEAIVAAHPGERRKVADAMQDAAGEQNVRFLNVEPNTRFAFVCVEADYLLKRLALGLDRSPVPTVRSYLSMQSGTDVNANRFWFETLYDQPLLVSPDGTAYEIRGQSVQINTRRSFTQADDPDNVSPAAKLFTSQATKLFEPLAAAIPAFADLENVSDLALLAALIGQDKLNDKADWDTSWITAKDGYPVAAFPVPQVAQTLVNYTLKGRTVLFAGGGVMLDMSAPVKPEARTSDGAADVSKLAKRPEGAVAR